MTTIRSVQVRLFNVPLAEVLVDAKHGNHTHFELVTATIKLSDGSEGTGYTYTGGKGGQAIKAMIEHDLAPFLIGKNADNVEALRRWQLTDAQLALPGEHPELGPVTLRQLLAAWVVHDLGHIAQIARVMAKQYKEAIGPWREYLPIVDR